MFQNKPKKHDWSNDGSFMSRPKHGWLHPNEQLHPEAGISYAVKYAGNIAVLESMRALDFETRTSITNESINRLCHALGLRSYHKYKKNPKVERYLGMNPNVNRSSLEVILTITTESLTIIDSETKDLLQQHLMPSISFASGGEPDTQDFVAYVAKGDSGRSCHVVECRDGLARDVITTIGQAFEIRFKNYLSQKAAPLTVPDCIPAALTCEAEYYNNRPDVQPPSPELGHHRQHRGFHDPGSDPDGFSHHQHHHRHHHHDHYPHPHHFHQHEARGSGKFSPIPSDYQHPVNNQPVRSESERGFEQNKNFPSSSSSSSKDNTVGRRSLENFQAFSSSVDGAVHASSSRHGLSPYHEIWFHGKISRQRSEELLMRSGDFLVRESPNPPGQFVLSGRQGNCVKHLLLVDPEGKVRTKDQLFNNVSHLVHYHQYNQVPIISNDSELLLINPIHCTSPQH